MLRVRVKEKVMVGVQDRVQGGFKREGEGEGTGVRVRVRVRVRIEGVRDEG